MTTKSKMEMAEYVGAHSKELARLAKDAGLDSLAYLLEVATLEAKTQAAAREAASG
jgi:hypothetical protein